MILPIKVIVPDPNQPRKYFNASKMRTLIESIKENGILNPIIVEKMVGENAGKYIVVDGERRFRAATELKLKEVPVIIGNAMSDTSRLIKQFHIQEQHEAWSPLEKAIALNSLSSSLKMSMLEVCSMLNMGPHEREIYSAFAELTDKTNFVRNEIPLSYARPFKAVRNFVKQVVEFDLEQSFILSDQKRLEGALVRSIKNGSIERPKDITKLKDAFKKNPKLIEKFIEDEKATPQSLFVEAGAKGAYYLRNLMINARYVTTNGARFIENNDVKVTLDELGQLMKTREVLNEVIDAIK